MNYHQFIDIQEMTSVPERMPDLREFSTRSKLMVNFKRLIKQKLLSADPSLTG